MLATLCELSQLLYFAVASLVVDMELGLLSLIECNLCWNWSEYINSLGLYLFQA